jgi:hypothetical protein
MSWTQYRWRGKPIEDIHQWCADRGEEMVRGTMRRTLPNPLTGRMVTEEQPFEMPESFFNNLLEMDGWIYELDTSPRNG